MGINTETENEISSTRRNKPESKEPESKEPESMEPESTEPESKEPESKEPESTEPESKEPESTEQESNKRPDVTKQASRNEEPRMSRQESDKEAPTLDKMLYITYNGLLGKTGLKQSIADQVQSNLQKGITGISNSNVFKVINIRTGPRTTSIEVVITDELSGEFTLKSIKDAIIRSIINRSF